MIYNETSCKHNFEEVLKSAVSITNKISVINEISIINDHTCAEEPPISCIQFVPFSPAVKFPVTKRSPSRLGGQYDDDHGDNDGHD